MRGWGFHYSPSRPHICVPSGQTAARKIEVRMQKGFSRKGKRWSEFPRGKVRGSPLTNMASELAH